MRLVEAQHMAVAIGLVVQAFADDHLGHGDQRGGVGRGLDEDVLVGERRLVRVRLGSTQTMRTPFFLASFRYW